MTWDFLANGTRRGGGEASLSLPGKPEPNCTTKKPEKRGAQLRPAGTLWRIHKCGNNHMTLFRVIPPIKLGLITLLGTPVFTNAHR